MEVFRISRAKYADRLSASGSANRWNKDGQYVIYAGASRSLASLELVVHRSYIQPVDRYKVMVISIEDDDLLFETIRSDQLPPNWQSIDAYGKLQEIGAEWYRDKISLVLKVPSAVIPQEYNYIIHTGHERFTESVSLVRMEDYFWDSRLL